MTFLKMSYYLYLIVFSNYFPASMGGGVKWYFGPPLFLHGGGRGPLPPPPGCTTAPPHHFSHLISATSKKFHRFFTYFFHFLKFFLVFSLSWGGRWIKGQMRILVRRAVHPLPPEITPLRGPHRNISSSNVWLKFHQKLARFERY